MNKEQSADDPRGSDSLKNMLNSTIFYELPWYLCACIEHKVSLEAFRAIEAALVKHDNNMKDYSLVVDWVTITANHSNYLVCDRRANTQSVCQESGKTATPITAMPS